MLFNGSFSGSEIKQFEKSETLGLYGSLLLIDYLSYGLV